jgi:hypothetical protein
MSGWHEPHDPLSDPPFSAPMTRPDRGGSEGLLREALERLPRFGVVGGQIAPHHKGTMIRLDDVLRLASESHSEARPAWITDDRGPQLHIEGSLVIFQTATDPGDMGEPRIVTEDETTYVAVPSFDLWGRPDARSASVAGLDVERLRLLNALSEAVGAAPAIRETRRQRAVLAAWKAIAEYARQAAAPLTGDTSQETECTTG